MMQNTAEENHHASSFAKGIRRCRCASTGRFHPGTGVGGAGEHWGGASFPLSAGLLSDWRSHLTEKHGAAKIVSGSLGPGLADQL